MTQEPDVGSERIVDLAVDALRSTPVPPAPPADALRAVLAAGEAEAVTMQPIAFRKRIFTMKRMMPVAAAVVVVGGIISAWVFIAGAPDGATVAWAEVQQKIRNVRTLTCKLTMHQEGKPDIEYRMMFKEGGRRRQEMTAPSRAINIMDVPSGKMISLIPAEKKAVTIDLSALPEEVRKRHEAQDPFGKLKELIEKSEKPLGEREIGGKAAKGYEVVQKGQTLSIWVDAATADPLEMEMTLFQGGSRIVLSDFALDKPLDDALFSLKVPEGYEVVSQMKLSEASAEDVAGMLEIWAAMRGGRFPDTVNLNELMKDMQKAGQPPSQEVGKKFGELVGRVFVLLPNPKRNIHYAGKGVKVGDKDTAIFWFLPAGGEKYKVIYGDLSIEDVAEEELPEAPAPEEQDQSTTKPSAPAEAPADSHAE